VECGKLKEREKGSAKITPHGKSPSLEIRKDTALRAEASGKSSERVKAKMSLVDNASSDDDVSEEENRENKENEPAQVPMDDDPQPPTTSPQTQ
jgi:hypothetical protein